MPPPPIPPSPKWPIPTLSIRVDDLAHPGASIFFEAVRPYDALKASVLASFEWLYTIDTVPSNVQVILLVLRPMDGVAYTFGTQTHKEIHFSLDHIVRSASRARDEIMGVLTHEVVHCFQYNALNSCPGGLIEGIAGKTTSVFLVAPYFRTHISWQDWVRLHAELAPPHWKKEAGEKWDAGYQATAYFLDWIEERYGQGTIREINDAMKTRFYTDELFKEATGRPVNKLWKLYCKALEDDAIGGIMHRLTSVNIQ